MVSTRKDPPLDARTRLIEMHAVERLAARDASLFADPQVAAQRLGWIGLPEAAAAGAERLAAIADEAVAAGITDVVLLGMGGSSLAALVLSRSIPGAPGHPALHVLDTTSPSQIRALLDLLAPAATLVIVSSKSGTSVEPLSLLSVLRSWMTATLGDDARDHFIALTDAGTPLETLASEDGFAHTVTTPTDVGGRYAALTPFATVPAALAGVDIERLTLTAGALEEACMAPGPDNPALALAAWMADAYADGRDKLTIVCSHEVSSFGLWVEQLVAESTGKLGRGLLPVLERAPGLPDAHGADRMTFVLRMEDDGELIELQHWLPDGEPVFEVVINDPYALAAEFVHWEWAVALFSADAGIECFDQPDVENAKAATRAILRKEAEPPERTALATGARLAASPGIPTVGIAAAAAALLERLPDHGYLAVLAYLAEDDAALTQLGAVCERVSVARRAPVTLELGPRYLHSTGQYHKGGPADGAFLVITVTDTVDVPIPGESFTLADLHAAQPAGDASALLSLGRTVLAVELPSIAGLTEVTTALAGAIGE